MSMLQDFMSTCIVLGLTAGFGSAQDTASRSRTVPATTVQFAPVSPAPVNTAKPTPDELKAQQLDVSLEARDVERVLQKLKRASDLAKQRITEAAVQAESVTASLNKGDPKAAQADAKQTSDKFKEIVTQLEALLKEDTPQQIAEAKQLAEKLAQLERQFAEQLDGMLNPVGSIGKGKVDEKSQVKPMADLDRKPQDGEGGAGEKKEGEGKSGSAKDAAKNPVLEGQDGEKKPDSQAGAEPMPGGQAGKKQADNSNEKKPGNGDEKKPGDGNDTKPANADDKKPGNGDEKKPGGGKSEKVRPDPAKSGEGQGAANNEDAKSENLKGGGSGKGKVDATESESTDGSSLTPEQRREAVARSAEKLAETGKTLQDVLNTIAKSNDPADREAAAKIQAVLKEIDINKLARQMDAIGGMVRSREDSDAKLSSVDIAERLEIIAGRLDSVYRGIIAPKAEELRKLEASLAELREKLEKLETPSQVATWHREARQLLDQLEKQGIDPEAREQLEKEMTQAGFGVDRNPTLRTVNWKLVNDRYDAPGVYTAVLISLQQDIQDRIQTLVLGDIDSLSDDTTPPQFQALVDRYYQVLSGERGKKLSAKKPNR